MFTVVREARGVWALVDRRKAGPTLQCQTVALYNNERDAKRAKREAEDAQQAEWDR
jgi:hypothetical protein